MVSRRSVKSVEDCILLYVEDDDATAFLFQTALDEEGIPVRLFRVTDGEEASAFLVRTGVYECAPVPDLVVLDVNLPRKSGLDVLADIRSDPHFADLPVVVFSTSVHPYDRERAVQLGANKYFTKEADLDAFVTSVRSICEMLPAGPALKIA
jgi:CheY-like chemotaxis protein